MFYTYLQQSVFSKVLFYYLIFPFVCLKSYSRNITMSAERYNFFMTVIQKSRFKGFFMWIHRNCVACWCYKKYPNNCQHNTHTFFLKRNDLMNFKQENVGTFIFEIYSHFYDGNIISMSTIKQIITRNVPKSTRYKMKLVIFT